MREHPISPSIILVKISPLVVPTVFKMPEKYFNDTLDDLEFSDSTGWVTR